MKDIFFWATTERIHLYFKCTPKLKHLKTLSDENHFIGTERNSIIQVYKDLEAVSIVGWYGYKGTETCIFEVFVPYEKNRCYSIDFDVSKLIEGSIERIAVGTKEPDHAEFIKNGLRVACHIPYNKAKKEYKALRKAHLISSPYMDPWSEGLDINCEACHVKDEPYEALSNPSDGRVLLLSEQDDPRFKNIEFKNYKNAFVYHGILYRKIKAHDWFHTTYWNKKEYENEAKWYHDRGLIHDKNGMVNQDHLKAWEKDWPKFEDFGKIHGFSYRSPEGKVFSEQIQPYWEPVVTKGWVTTPYDDSVICPVCKRLYDVVAAYPEWSNWFVEKLATIEFKFWQWRRKWLKNT